MLVMICSALVTLVVVLLLGLIKHQITICKTLKKQMKEEAIHGITLMDMILREV